MYKLVGWNSMIVTVHQRHECNDDLSHEGPSTLNGLEVQRVTNEARVKFFCLEHLSNYIWN